MSWEHLYVPRFVKRQCQRHCRMVFIIGKFHGNKKRLCMLVLEPQTPCTKSLLNSGPSDNLSCAEQKPALSPRHDIRGFHIGDARLGGVRIFDVCIKSQHDAQWRASNYRSRPITDFLTCASKFCCRVTNVKTPIVLSVSAPNGPKQETRT